MKLFYILFALLCCVPLSAQSEVIVGKYEKITDATNAYIQYTLELKHDGTFEFHSYYSLEARLEPESHNYGRGTWTADKKVVILNTWPSDLSENTRFIFWEPKGGLSVHPLGINQIGKYLLPFDFLNLKFYRFGLC